MFFFLYFQAIEGWCLVSSLVGQFGMYQPWGPLSLMTLSISRGSDPKENPPVTPLGLAPPACSGDDEFLLE